MKRGNLTILLLAWLSVSALSPGDAAARSNW